MPLPIIIAWGAAAALSAYGVKKGFDAKANVKRATEIGNIAENRYKSAKSELERCRTETQQFLQELGKLKVAIFNNQINHLVEVIKKAKSVKSKLTGFDHDISVEELKEYEHLVLQSL